MRFNDRTQIDSPRPQSFCSVGVEGLEETLQNRRRDRISKLVSDRPDERPPDRRSRHLRARNTGPTARNPDFASLFPKALLSFCLSETGDSRMEHQAEHKRRLNIVGRAARTKRIFARLRD